MDQWLKWGATVVKVPVLPTYDSSSIIPGFRKQPSTRATRSTLPLGEKARLKVLFSILLDATVERCLAEKPEAKEMEISDLVTELLKKEIEIIEAVK